MAVQLAFTVDEKTGVGVNCFGCIQSGRNGFVGSICEALR